MRRLKRPGLCWMELLWFPIHAAKRSRMDGARRILRVLTSLEGL